MAEPVPEPCDQRSPLVLVSGPVRSGKSAWAEHLASASGAMVVYLATGPSRQDDPSWQQRLLRHRSRRPVHWLTEETGAALPEALGRHSSPDRLLLVDSLGTWLVHHLDLDPAAWQVEQQRLLAAVLGCEASVVLVAEEVGWGLVPPTAIGGLFRDRLGELLEALEPLCSQSWLVIRGRAVELSRLGVCVPGSGR